ncbi:uncharacterized protein LOC109611641 [Musca domestica]|uniref:Uncharacterized protein LOC109611641 n=1 Tax=Musca domestica TaxID=7370 RepID=A0A9J7DBB3_MUSDO|nr:uncharacterized protein LOC109611641 [Musca domestica]
MKNIFRHKRATSLNKTSRANNAIPCTEHVPTCTLSCSGGTVSYVDEELEYLQTACYKKQLTLILENCTFTNGVLKATFFSGFYNLQELQIKNCNLASIQEGAFQKTTVANLLKLKLINNTITTLNDQTFGGLKTLEYFEFSQEALGQGKQFQGSKFLNPFAETLQWALVKQITIAETILNPHDWWLGVDFPSLTSLDLSHNNLRGILKVDTFQNMKALQDLHLEDCNLDKLDLAPFGVVGTLKSLNLNFNHLKSLDLHFLQDLHGRGIEVRLKGNEWHCDCENQEIMEYLRNLDTTTIHVEDLICFSPAEYHQMPMMDVSLVCEEESDTSTMATVASTTGETSTKFDGITTSMPPFTTTPSTTIASPGDKTPTSTIAPPTDNGTLLDCSYIKDSYELCFSLYIPAKFLNFTITISSATSVVITSLTPVNQFIQFIYFTNSKEAHNNTQQIARDQWKINDLQTGETYIFCVLSDIDNTIATPYDCQALYFDISLQGWLHSSDMYWLAMVLAVACINCYLLGIVLGYFLWRKKPNYNLNTIDYEEWLGKKSPLLLRMSSLSNNVAATYLNPTLTPDYDNDTTSQQLYNSFHKPPQEMAPTPPNKYGHILLPSPGYSKKIPNLNINSECNLTNSKIPNNRNCNCNGMETNIYEVVQDSMRRVEDHHLPVMCETKATINNYQLEDDVYHEIDHYEVVNY